MDSKFTWQFKEVPAQQKIQTLSTQFHLTSQTSALLLQRGLTASDEIKQFLNPDLADLNDPLALHDMAAAIERIQAAIMADEKIMIYGDYDVDGLTSTAIMKAAIEALGGSAQYYIPNRFEDGYGPNLNVYKRLIASGVNLIITVDNGIAGKAAIDYAQSHGVDVVVTDHHELPETLPDAVAVVHPRYPGSNYPCKDLSGAGVAFKVASALLEEVPTDLLDLAALGTVADLVSLTAENRIIVTYGLKALQQTTRPGLKALYQVAKINPATITETTIGFGIGPRLNALGRMGDANPGVALLTTLDADFANEMATKIQTTNTQRQKLVQEISQQALVQAADPQNQTAKTLIIAGQNWHEGVLGIVASHVVEKTGKPTIILNIDPATKLAKGSGRSVPDFHLFNSLTAQRAQMTNFGGHHMAVGLTLPAANIEAVHQGMEAYAVKTDFKIVAKPTKNVDLTLDLVQCNRDFYDELQQLAPFGTDNPQPLFEIKGLTIASLRQIGKDQQHLKLDLKTGANHITTLAFGFGASFAALQHYTGELAVIGTLDLNEFNHQTTLQLMLTDFTLAQSPQAQAKTEGPNIRVMKKQRLTVQLFDNPGLYVFFKQQYLEKIAPLVADKPATLSLFSEDVVVSAPKILVVDQPSNFEQLNFFLEQQQAQELTFTFFAPQKRLFKLPDRRMFATTLKYIEAHQDLQVAGTAQIAAYLQMDPVQLRFILKVFSQLGFVKMNDGLINPLDIHTKKALDTAPTYRAMVQQLDVAQRIAENTNEKLQQLILEQLKQAGK
ncbi:MAG: single-stranded-DNA-specific exonuclease RecJ [Lactobacillus sp.]|nr:single-stranded-DNA-specific exonuclease RecJ [Lactobacillus sp.]